MIPENGESAGTPLGNVARDAGYFTAAFGNDPLHPMMASAPKGSLGPLYRVTYVVPGPNGKSSLVRQTLYPYAADSYMPAKQPFMGGMLTAGGWFYGGRALKHDLVALGLPAVAPGGGFSLPASVIARIALGAALTVAAFAALRLRRRPQPVPA